MKNPKRISGEQFVKKVVNSNRPIQISREGLEDPRYRELVARLFTLRLERAGFFKP